MSLYLVTWQVCESLMSKGLGVQIPGFLLQVQCCRSGCTDALFSSVTHRRNSEQNSSHYKIFSESLLVASSPKILYLVSVLLSEV